MVSSQLFCTYCGAANPVQAKFCFSCGQTLNGQEQVAPSTDITEQSRAPKKVSPDGQLKPGTVLKQRYKILSQIGQGGFGAVYKAEDQELGQRLLAVKEMSQQPFHSQEIEAGVEAFKHEALMLAGLMHEHLPRIYDHFMDGERWYLIMDYIEGETLENHFEKSRDGSLPLAMTLRIALQLCEVLDYLHTRQPPIIFRDLKPSNVILTPKGGLFLIDFGIARHFKPGQAKDTIAFGSPGYAAPEQYGKAQTTPRADIYSLGAILHQMLSGADPSLSPFHFAPIRGQDPALLHLVKRMLEIDAEQRPASVLEVKQTLQYMRDHPAASASLVTRAGQVLPAAPVTIKHAALPVGMPALFTPIVMHEHHYGVVRTVAWSPDSKYAASATEAIIRIWHAHSNQNVCSYHQHIGIIKHMAWSPASMHIASVSEDNKIHIWDASSGQTFRFYLGDPGSNRNVTEVLAWSHDGRYLAAAGRKYLHVWDTSEHKIVTKVRSKVFAGYNSLSWSPDGKILALAQSNMVLVYKLDLTTRPAITYYRYAAHINALAWSPNGAYLASGGNDRVVNVWNMHTNTLVGTYHNHIQPVSTLSWSPDSRHIASGSFAANINIWDAMTGLDVVSYYAHAGSVLSVAWSPDGRSILSGGSDRRVCIWQAP
ncbi:MAG TPA: WD40 repeat domain-containing serine/threonine-protein kinase [Ktedonobacteraceae bacterium]|nr:WD40 repeat domain-containing serine/threonine-protein kinase [Ktedonobacteraceae bacterium]